MAFRKFKIVNCKKASIRAKPWIPIEENDIVGVKDGIEETAETVKGGEFVEVDLDETAYDWTGKKFYKVREPDGWIYSGCIGLGGG